MPPSTPSPTSNVLPIQAKPHGDAVRIVIDWLTDRHRKGWLTAFKDWLDELQDEHEDRDYGALDQDAMQMLEINGNEWLLARGQIHAKGGLRNVNDYLLGPHGPYLESAQADWIAQLKARPLRLYRVTDLQVGQGFTLVDELDADAAPAKVTERSGSRGAHVGMLLGVRLMSLDNDTQLSGAIYNIAPLREAALLAQVRAAQQAALQPQDRLELAEMAIARAWLAQWFEPAPMPQLRDAGSGDAMLLVTDHYQVLDAETLAAALAAQPDVHGDAEQGWHRDVDAGGGLWRSLAAINPGKSAKRIEIFYRTQGLADTGRAWFDTLAGGAVKHLTRAVVDPTSPAALAGASKQARPPAQPNKMLPSELGEVMAQFIHQHYAHWADEVIPALGGKTPRQAITTPSGLERVKGLLRQYESGEAEQAQDQGRPVVSYQFLWDALGLKR